MELTKNIFFNTDKLVENSKVKISYTGKFFQDNSEKVFFHYGFGENWENSQDQIMQKSELGFQADIYVQPNTKLNFCFKNSNGEWDNNNGTNYAFKIEKNPCNENENTINNTQNVENIQNTQYVQNVQNEKSLCNITSTWGELIKKTFNNFVNYISKIFSTNKENVKNNNN